jgi:MFS family permease
MALGACLFGVAPSMLSMGVTRFLQGMAGSFIQISQTGLLMEYSDHVDWDMATQEWVTVLGVVMGPPLGGILSEKLSLAVMFTALAAGPLLIAALLIAARCGMKSLPASAGEVTEVSRGATGGTDAALSFLGGRAKRRRRSDSCLWP